MTVSSVATTGASTSTKQSSTQSLAGNFDTFLKLLTTQLKQQDPLQPMDATAFTAQLVQFATVEQAIQTNSKLSDLTAATTANQTMGAAGLIGQDAVASTKQVELPAGSDATIEYELPRAAASVQVTVRDANGRLVAQTTGETGAGDHQLAWNGQGIDGNRLPAGVYSVGIVAKDAAGTGIEATQLVRGTVQGVENGTSGVGLKLGALSVPLASLREVHAHTA